MCLIRATEDRILQLFKEGKIPGSTHLSQGQEAVSVGVISCLSPQDYVIGTYRGHGEAIAKGVNPREVISEILGKATGCCKGNGGSMHMSKKGIGLIGTFSIVAAGMPCAVGLGLGSKLRGDNRITVCFFGDGATNNGTFHEALNMAAIWNVPVIFACVNNLYAEYSALSSTTKVKDLAERAHSYGMEGVICDGNDFFAVRKSTLTAIKKIHEQKGPIFIEFKTYRRGGHSRLDDGSTYRPKEEIEYWLRRDPILIMANELKRREILDSKKEEEIWKDIGATLEEATKFALSAPYPPTSQAFEYVMCTD
jgi:TPP-dependent pyruvate/acetoin dehydrogenase alpha subunit